MKFRLFLLLAILTTSNLIYAQVEFSGSVNLEGHFSTKDKLPFWFYSNQRGRVSEETNIDGWINGKLNYKISEETSLEIGGGLLYQDALKDEILIDELYADFKYKWLQFIAGRKQEAELYNGLSASNENILWSLNARPIPGIQFKTRHPIFFTSNRRFGFEASWEEYYLGNNPGAEKVRLHHKNLSVLYHFNNGWKVKAGIQHFVQWGGSSDRFGDQPNGFEDYIRIVTGRGGGENSLESDQANALGNHLGSWEVYVSKEYRDYSFSFIYNNLFEDGSGSRLANFPDGRYGFFIDSHNKEKLVNSFMYELYYTREQSQTGPHLYDNYFNNGVYPFGWTYKGRVVGVPFFTYDPELNYIVNNKFITHHFGISGQFSTYFQNYPYKVLLSYAHNEGTYRKPLNSEGLNEDVLNFYSKIRVLNLPVQADLTFGFDFNSIKEPVFGAGISLSREF